jgi:hypothetical protein
VSARGAILVGLLLASGSARAAEADSVRLARAAYARAARAYDAGDYAVAAQQFALADELAPNAVALRQALAAALRADDPVLGMTLVERAGARPDDASLEPAIESARAKFAARVGRVAILCANACGAAIDGVAAVGVCVVSPGPHAVTFYEGRVRTTVVVPAGATVTAAPPLSPAPEVRPPARSKGGLSPAWFWAAAAVTGASAVAATVSGVAMFHQHDVYARDPTPEGARDGRAAQFRTNVLIGVTAAAAAGSAALALFAVRWSKDSELLVGAARAAFVVRY